MAKISIFILLFLFLTGFPCRVTHADSYLNTEESKLKSRIIEKEKKLAVHPHRTDIQVQLAYLYGWNQNFSKAEKLFRAVLARHPLHEEATLGLAKVLWWQGQRKESLELLEGILNLNATHQEALDLTRKVIQDQKSQRIYRITGGYEWQQMSFTSNGHQSPWLFEYIKSKKWGGRLGYSFVNKFRQDAHITSLGFLYWPSEQTALNFDIGISPDQGIEAQQSYRFEITHIFLKKIIPLLAYQYRDYQSANIHIISIGTTWNFLPQWYISGGHILSVSQLPSRDTINHSFTSKIGWSPIDSLDIFSGYSRSNESFESGNPLTPIGSFAAHHIFSGIRWKFHKHFGTQLTYGHENRDNGQALNALSTRLFYEW